MPALELLGETVLSPKSHEMAAPNTNPQLLSFSATRRWFAVLGPETANSLMNLALKDFMGLYRGGHMRAGRKL